MNTTTPSAAPLSAEELAMKRRVFEYLKALRDGGADDPTMKDGDWELLEGAVFDDQRWLETIDTAHAGIRAKDEIIAGLRTLGNDLQESLDSCLDQLISQSARAETAESRVKALEEALRPFAKYGRCLGPIMDQMSNPISISTSRGQAQVTPADFIAAASLSPPTQVTEKEGT